MFYKNILNKHIHTLKTAFTNKHNQVCKGFRYVDDLFILFAYDKTNPITYEFAKLMRLLLCKHTYHPNMLLKTEQMIDNSIPFLETKITYNGGTSFDIIHHDKNFQSLYTKNKLTKVKTIHANSFSPKTQKSNIILNTLHRINTNCSSDYLTLKATLQHFFTSQHFGYKRTHFKKALNNIAICTNNDLWHLINMLI